MESIKAESINDIKYWGVESREEVLQQVAKGNIEVIDLDSDPHSPINQDIHINDFAFHTLSPCSSTCQYDDSLPPTQHGSKRVRTESIDDLEDITRSTKRTKLADNNVAHIHGEHLEEGHSDLASMPESTSGLSTTQYPPQNLKKSLWHSSNAEENMSRISGLPSPESLQSNSSVESGSQEQLNHNGPLSCIPSTWSFEDIEELSTISNPSSPPHENTADVNPGGGSLQSLSFGRASGGITETLRRKKEEIAKQGIAESQRLREENQRRKQRISSLTNTTASDHISARTAEGSTHKRKNNRLPMQDDRSLDDMSLSSRDDPNVIECLLDIAEEHERSRYESNVHSVDASASKARRGNAPQPNPFSRHAAERWRTQDRHLSHSQGSAKASPSPYAPSHERQVSSEQDKEERMARVLQRSRWSNLARMDKEAEKRLLSTKFHGVHLRSDSRKAKVTAKPRSHARSVEEAQNNLHKLMGTSHAPTLGRALSQNRTTEQMNTQVQSASDRAPTCDSRPSLCVLNRLNSKTDKPASDSKQHEAIPQKIFDDLPQYADIGMQRAQKPGKFDEYSEEEQKLFLERVSKREREKDLETISKVFSVGAQLGSLVPFDPRDAKTLQQLSNIRGFAEAVLNHGKSGKPLREKIRAIRGSFKKRLDTIGKVPDNETASDYLSVLLQPKLYERLISETADTAGRLVYLASECHKINSSHHSKNPPTLGLSSTKVSTRERVGIKKISSTRPLSAKQTLAQLRSTLGLFDQGSVASEDKAEVIDLGPSRNDENDGEVSEEDEGEIFMRPVGLEKQDSSITVPQGVPTSQYVSLREQESRAQVEAQPAATSQTCQGADQRLLHHMLTKQKQQAHLATLGVQKSSPQIALDGRQKQATRTASSSEQTNVVAESLDHKNSEDATNYDIEDASSQEFDDSDIDVEDDDRSEEDDGDDDSNGPECKRYVAKGVCQGLSACYDSDVHVLGNFLHKDNASKAAASFSAWVREQMQKSHPEHGVDNFRETISKTKSSFEQKVVFGDDDKVSCRAWIEVELYKPSEEAYEKAKVRKACESPDIWFVDWERTIKPAEEQDEDQEPERKSSTESGRSSPTLNESTREGGTHNTDDANAERPTDQNNSTNNDITQADSATSLLSAHGENVFDTATSVSEIVNPERDDTTENTAMANDDTNRDLNAPAINDQNEDDDDLFGPESPEPITIPTSPTMTSSVEQASAKTPSPAPNSEQSYERSAPDAVVTRATGDHIRIFTNLAHANRHAKDVFMYWYIDHLPGRANQRFIEIQDEAMEEELRAIGNQSCWSHTESFEKERDGDGPGENVQMVDQFRVWVRKGKCSGPSN